MKDLRRSASLALALALAACGHSAPTTLHTLGSRAPLRTFADYAGPPVRVGSVRLPPAIDRIEMLRETGADRYVVLEFDRWAAPPARLARQALAEDLAIRLPAGTVIAGADDGTRPAVALAVEVLSFSDRAGTAMLAASWTLACPPGGTPARGGARLEAPSSGDTPAALTELLGQLADRIAVDLAAFPGQCRSSP